MESCWKSVQRCCLPCLCLLLLFATPLYAGKSAIELQREQEERAAATRNLKKPDATSQRVRTTVQQSRQLNHKLNQKYLKALERVSSKKCSVAYDPSTTALANAVTLQQEMDAWSGMMTACRKAGPMLYKKELQTKIANYAAKYPGAKTSIARQPGTMVKQQQKQQKKGGGKRQSSGKPADAWSVNQWSQAAVKPTSAKQKGSGAKTAKQASGSGSSKSKQEKKTGSSGNSSKYAIKKGAGSGNNRQKQPPSDAWTNSQWSQAAAKSTRAKQKGSGSKPAKQATAAGSSGAKKKSGGAKKVKQSPGAGSGVKSKHGGANKKNKPSTKGSARATASRGGAGRKQAKPSSATAKSPANGVGKQNTLPKGAWTKKQWRLANAKSAKQGKGGSVPAAQSKKSAKGPAKKIGGKSTLKSSGGNAMKGYKVKIIGDKSQPKKLVKGHDVQQHKTITIVRKGKPPKPVVGKGITPGKKMRGKKINPALLPDVIYELWQKDVYTRQARIADSRLKLLHRKQASKATAPRRTSPDQAQKPSAGKQQKMASIPGGNTTNSTDVAQQRAGTAVPPNAWNRKAWDQAAKSNNGATPPSAGAPVGHTGAYAQAATTLQRSQFPNLPGRTVNGSGVAANTAGTKSGNVDVTQGKRGSGHIVAGGKGSGAGIGKGAGFGLSGDGSSASGTGGSGTRDSGAGGSGSGSSGGGGLAGSGSSGSSGGGGSGMPGGSSGSSGGASVSSGGSSVFSSIGASSGGGIGASGGSDSGMDMSGDDSASGGSASQPDVSSSSNPSDDDSSQPPQQQETLPEEQIQDAGGNGSGNGQSAADDSPVDEPQQEPTPGDEQQNDTAPADDPQQGVIENDSSAGDGIVDSPSKSNGEADGADAPSGTIDSQVSNDDSVSNDSATDDLSGSASAGNKTADGGTGADDSKTSDHLASDSSQKAESLPSESIVNDEDGNSSAPISAGGDDSTDSKSSVVSTEDTKDQASLDKFWKSKPPTKVAEDVPQHFTKVETENVVASAKVSEAVYHFNNPEYSGVFKKNEDGYIVPNGMKMIDHMDNQSGLQSAAYLDKKNNTIYVAYRGTEPSELNDLLSDADIGINEILGTQGRGSTSKGLSSGQISGGRPGGTHLGAQLKDATHFTNRVLEKYPSAKVVLTGHSLGGAIAQFEGARSGRETHAYNAPGMGNVIDKLLPGRSTSNIYNHNREGDVVSKIGKQVGHQAYYPEVGHNATVVTPSGVQSGGDAQYGTRMENAYVSAEKSFDKNIATDTSRFGPIRGTAISAGRSALSALGGIVSPEGRAHSMQNMYVDYLDGMSSVRWKLDPNYNVSEKQRTSDIELKPSP